MQERPKFQLSDAVRVCDKAGIVHIHIRCGGVLLVLIGFHFPALNNAYAILLNISYYREFELKSYQKTCGEALMATNIQNSPSNNKKQCVK